MPATQIHVDFGIWGIIRKVAVGTVVVAILIGLGLWYIPVLKQSQKLREEIALKRGKLKQQQELHAKYSAEISALRTDPETVERAVREKLGLIKPFETIYLFETPKR
jgi:cell division protein FtsB